MKVVAIIQARMGSTRLPGKVMKPLMDKTVLAHVVERCKAIGSINEVVVATTTNREDDILCAECEKLGVHWFRGSELDVLSRYYFAAQEAEADAVVRITSDCPLLDVQVSDSIIRKFLEKGSLDYLSNKVEPTYPIGLDTEVFTFRALEQSYKMASKDYEREHVTPFIYMNPQLFKFEIFKHPIDYSPLRWTLDTEEDYEFIKQVYQELYRTDEFISMADVLNLLERKPNLAEINSFVKQKALGE
jgi:spore coat polysaccharide biosynthesis protein SpsF